MDNKYSLGDLLIAGRLLWLYARRGVNEYYATFNDVGMGDSPGRDIVRQETTGQIDGHLEDICHQMAACYDKLRLPERASRLREAAQQYHTSAGRLLERSK